MSKSSQKLIVFDLDETLVHATKHKLDLKEDFKYEDYFVYKRPWVDEFLVAVSQLFTIAIWSSADDEYVHSIASQLLPESLKPAFVWGRSECWMKIAKIEDPKTGLKMKDYQNIKPLEKIRRKGYKMKHLLIVDDSKFKVVDNPNNYLLIKPFKGDFNDNELKKLYAFFKEIALSDDFRKLEKKNGGDD